MSNEPIGNLMRWWRKTVLCAVLILISIGMAQAGMIKTIVGKNANAQNPSSPMFIAFDAAGTLHFTEGYGLIRKLLSNGQVVTVAGTGAQGYSGDGGPALAATLGAPAGLAFDSAGNLYFSDLLNNVIRKIDGKGDISTYAGTGVAGYTGDGGLATAATLRIPYGLCFDPDGNLYVADTGNDVIRKIDVSGRISTMVGNGQAGYAGDGGMAGAALLNSPYSVALDSTGNIYIADYNNAVVRKVDAHGIITTFAGNGLFRYAGDGGTAISASFISPAGITVDAAGNVYVSDMRGGVVRKIDAAGNITTPAGRYRIDDIVSIYYAAIGDGGPAESAILSYPLGVAIDANGNLDIADTLDGRIRQVVGGTANYTANAVGLITSQSISVGITPATGLAGQPGATFVAVQLLNGQIYVLESAGWSDLDQYISKGYTVGNLQPFSTQIASNLNLSDLAGANVYVGYGRGNTLDQSWNDMLTNLTFQSVYTVR